MRIMKKQLLLLSLVLVNQISLSGTGSSIEELVDIPELTNMTGKHPRFFKKFILRFRNKGSFSRDNRALLYGPPGTGKTTYPKELARVLGCNYLEVSCCNIITEWQQSGSKNIHKLSLIAKNGYLEQDDGEWVVPQYSCEYNPNRPTIINFDELDVLFETRSFGSRENRECVAALIAFLDKLTDSERDRIFIFFTTNYINKIPSQILDRLARNKLNIVLPADSKRLFLFKFYLRGYIFSEKAYEQFVSTSNGLSSRSIQDACLGAIEDAEDYNTPLTVELVIKAIQDQTVKAGLFRKVMNGIEANKGDLENANLLLNTVRNGIGCFFPGSFNWGSDKSDKSSNENSD